MLWGPEGLGLESAQAEGERVRARCTATPTRSCNRVPKRSVSMCSRVKLCTVRMDANDSSAMPIASPIRSCTCVLALRSARPKVNAAATTTGTTARVVSVRRGLVTNIMVMPPTRNSVCRESSEIHVLNSDCRSARSLLSRLVSSPVRRSVKKAGESRIRCAKVCSRSVATIRSVVELSRSTCTKFATACTAKTPRRPRAMRSSASRSRCSKAASSR